MRLLLILALLCAPLLYSQADPVRKPAPKPGQSDIRDGEEAFAKGEMQAAVEHFTAALKAQPENDEAYSYRAAAHIALGAYEDADTDLAAAMKLETTFSLAWNSRGYLHWLRGEFAPAIEDYTTAIAYAAADRRVDTGGRSQIYQNRGVAWQDAGNTDRALLDFDTCIDLLPDQPAFYENRGLIYVDKKLFDIAFKDFDRALELDPKNARAYVNRAWAARLMGDYEQAVRDYSQALRLKADYAQALIGRGYAWLAWKRIEPAEADFVTASKLDGFEAAGLAGQGDVRLYQREWRKAADLFAKAHGADLNNEAALRGLAVAYGQLDDWQHAEAYANGLCRLQPSSESSWLLLGEVRTQLNDWEGALVAYRRALELVPDNFDARRFALDCHVLRKEYKLALDAADMLIALDAGKGHIQKARVYAARNNGPQDQNSAVAELDSAALLDEDLRPLRTDPHFESLQKMERFIALTGGR